MSRDFPQTTSDTPLGGRYKIIGELGAGGFGKTFLAQDTHLPGHPQCVIKQFKPQTNDEKSLVMASRLFDTEAQVLYQLGNHDQIPRLLAHFEENQEFYLAQELIEGEPLSKELAGNQPWSEVQVLALLQDILQVLAFVHEQQVIHRDIKPANLIRRKQDGKIVLIDFGAVKQVSAQLVNPDAGPTNLTISIGTQGYMPNEQLAGSPRYSSDIYAVGMLCIQALTGIHPTRLKEDPETGEIEWRDRAPLVSPEFADLLERMVRYDFRDRYPTATEALSALQSLPTELLESVPVPTVRDTIDPIEDATPSQQKRASSKVTAPTDLEPTEPEGEPESESQPEPESNVTSTSLWVAAEPGNETSTSASRTDEPTAPLPQQASPPPTSEISEPTSGRPRLTQRKLVKPLSALAVLVAVGATLALIPTVRFSQQTPRTPNRNGTPTASPTPNPSVATPTPSPKPSKKPQLSELMSEADRLRKAGEYEDALELYDQVIAMKPKMAEAYWGRCQSLNLLKKPTEAIVACNDAIDLKSNYAEAIWGKGMAIEQQQKQSLEALWLYEKATRLKPNFADAWVSRGKALQEFGRSAEAIDALDEAIDLNRNRPDAWSTKGEALWNLGRQDEAIEALDKALQLNPDHPEAKKLRAKLREEVGR